MVDNFFNDSSKTQHKMTRVIQDIQVFRKFHETKIFREFHETKVVQKNPQRLQRTLREFRESIHEIREWRCCRGIIKARIRILKRASRRVMVRYRVNKDRRERIREFILRTNIDYYVSREMFY